MKVDERRFTGIAAAPGVAVATAWQPRRDLTSAMDSVHGDDESVRKAFATVGESLVALAAEMRHDGLPEEADIVTAEAAIACDEELLAAVLAEMAKGATAGAAVVRAGEHFAQMLESLESEYLRERAADVRQVARRALTVLAGGEGSPPPSTPFVLVDADVGPIDLLEVAAHGLAGAVSLHGGVNAHAAIVARSLGIPLLIGVDPARLAILDGSDVVLDADRSVLVIDPSCEARADADRRIADAMSRRALFAVERALPTFTSDGVSVVLGCNVASAQEVTIGLAAAAAGVGLLRTELQFLHAHRWPDEALHRDTLRRIFAHLDGLPVTVRLMDFSNDKVPPFLVSGLEGLDALLDSPQALRAQLRAVVDVGRYARTRVMLPMVRRAEQVTTVRAELLDIADRAGVPAPALGVMIELPEAVERAAEIAAVSDFFSLGTNDLTAAVLGLTRTDQGARPALAAHPEVLACIAATCSAAAHAGINVSVCGDAGGEPLVLPLLLGAGVTQFSVSPARVDEVRYRIRRLDAGAWAARLPTVLTLPTVDSVWAYVEDVASR
ncbi:MAG: multiphosphoryl transfer protein [Frankiaceae bacterium]|nr:multiphosphoryl transfer protein [Frankiaceae bacterium]